jgi:hypothetical protein
MRKTHIFSGASEGQRVDSIPNCEEQSSIIAGQSKITRSGAAFTIYAASP